MCRCCRVPSFTHDNAVSGKGVVFGRKLKSREEMLQSIGYPFPPAPGGNCRVSGRADLWDTDCVAAFAM